MTTTLFELPSPEVPRGQSALKPEPRVQRPNREQVELRPVDLEALLPADHRARVVWEFVEGLDLAPLYGAIKAVEGHAGRPPIDPAILMALWLYATVEGVGSARALARLCQAHEAYRWLCGGVSVNSHTLADFRVQPVEELDRLLTTSVATLMAEGLVSLTRVAQDGGRVRASAGAASLRRQARLEGFVAEAAAQIEALRQELHDEPGATTRRPAAARPRAAAERQQRVAQALAHVPEIAAKKPAAEAEKARASTTDPEARVMKMADGGFRPAFNGQFAAATASQVIVGVDLTNVGSDRGQLAPMIEQLPQRYDQGPAQVLVDGGFATHEDILAVEQPAVGCTVYAPVPKPRNGAARDPYQPRPGGAEGIGQWRARMGTEAAQRIYRERAATAECVNAIARNRGLQQFRVRGRQKVRAVLLWFALAHNLMRAVALRQAVAAPV